MEGVLDFHLTRGGLKRVERAHNLSYSETKYEQQNQKLKEKERNKEKEKALKNIDLCLTDIEQRLSNIEALL